MKTLPRSQTARPRRRARGPTRCRQLIATAGPAAPVFVIGLTGMLILFGAGPSRFKQTGTAFATRLLYVLLVGGFAIGMLALFEPLRPRSEQ